MAKILYLTAGLLLSVAVASAHAATDCKANPGNAACTPPKAAGTSTAPKAQAAAKSVTPKPLPEPHAVSDAKGKPAAKPASPSSAPAKLASRPARQPRTLARRGGHHEKPPTREARRAFQPPVAEYRPHSGPVYETPYGFAPPAMGCDETCQYRDWLNRYAAWYRDFGRYYYGAGPGGMTPNRSAAPPPALSYNDPPPASAAPAQLDQSERDRMDPWHGYNRHNGLGNGY